MLQIIDLSVEVEGNSILKGLNLSVQQGEIHAIMGPNGAGKSTLAKILEMEPEERAHAGIFMGFQYPIEIPGVSNVQFMRMACNSKRRANGESEYSEVEFEKIFDDKLKELEIRPEFKERNVNENFSGGEKKRNEILQMALLNPFLAVLDETDSGLDIDAMRIVAGGVNKIMNPKMGLILITHYQRLLDYIKPDKVHVMLDGRIIKSGGPELALVLEEKGYDWLIPGANS
jgi:Fe-S cluster assembly ATP-binding protein